jgi:hypothetical protein
MRYSSINVQIKSLLCGAETDISLFLVKKMIILLQMKFCWLLKAILLKCPLMTFFQDTNEDLMF